MMHGSVRAALAAAALIVLPVQAMAECTIGPAPDVPNGATASAAEMAAGQQALKAHVVETQEYLECLEAVSRGSFTAEITARYNEAADQMSELSLRMNAEIRAFKARG